LATLNLKQGRDGGSEALRVAPLVLVKKINENHGNYYRADEFRYFNPEYPVNPVKKVFLKT